jgi:hypothetical protein
MNPQASCVQVEHAIITQTAQLPHCEARREPIIRHAVRLWPQPQVPTTKRLGRPQAASGQALGLTTASIAFGSIVLHASEAR